MPNHSKVVWIDHYELVNFDEPIQLEISIGFKQRSSTTVLLDGERIIDNAEGSFSIELGSSSSLSGKVLDIYTTVKDRNPDTDLTGIKVSIIGQRQLEKVLYSKVNVSGGKEFYNVTIYFV